MQESSLRGRGPNGASRRGCILRYVLDGEFAQAFVRRFAQRPDWRRPELWPVITDPARASQRRWLSLALGQLPERQRRNALARLQSDKHFLASYNELAAAAVLSTPGLRVEIEPSFTWQGTTLTPDLALRSVDGRLLAIGEVSTRFRSAEHRSLEIQWRELRARVARIPRPVGLLVQDLVHDPIRPPTSGQAAKLERGLRGWVRLAHSDALTPLPPRSATCRPMQRAPAPGGGPPNLWQDEGLARSDALDVTLGSSGRYAHRFIPC